MSDDRVPATSQQPPRTPAPDGPKSPVERRSSGITPVPPYPPVDLAPEPGCDLCAWWDRRRENAQIGIDSATPLECARQIASHPHRRAGDLR
ncbi:hypothetical protein AB0P17_35790 [Streptomyces sp. NPDC088124]|uniref:hypothetical protein n=1 Tax=Streptomyces sp. NPDC088124 TaxID=3154654 RepID=UPI003424A1FA